MDCYLSHETTDFYNMSEHIPDENLLMLDITSFERERERASAYLNSSSFFFQL